MDEVPFCCTQASLSLSNFYQGLPCNNRSLQLQETPINIYAGYSQLAQSHQAPELGNKDTARPAWARCPCPYHTSFSPNYSLLSAGGFSSAPVLPAQL